MPLVFIHGVRQRSQQGLDRLARQFARTIDDLRKQVPLPEPFSVLAPYWGSEGVDPYPARINPATSVRGIRESTAVANDAASDALATLRDACDGDVERMRALLRLHAGSAAEEPVFAGLLQDDLATSYADATRQAAVSDSPDDLLERRRPLGDSVLVRRDALARFADVVQRAASAAALHSSMVRDWVDECHHNFAVFTGDSIKYVMERERRGSDSPILRKVLEAFPARQDDEPLLLVTHSMGTQIAYDVLTCYRPELRVACWISVGGQVAQFHRLGLLKAQEEQGAPVGLGQRVRRWINVFDPQDVLCFLAHPVFPEARDVAYRTSRGPLGNHSWYFREQPFYDLMLAHFAEALRA